MDHLGGMPGARAGTDGRSRVLHAGITLGDSWSLCGTGALDTLG